MRLEELQTVVFAPKVTLDYTNHRGVMSRREIIPIRFWRGISPWHAGTDSEDYLVAFDLGKDDVRDFAVKDIRSWEEVPRMHLGAEMEAHRSSQWPRVRREHLELNGSCKACGAVKNLEVHHIAPFHLSPEQELDPFNLVTLCETPSHNCHFLFGHLLDWRAYNIMVLDDAARMYAAIKNRTYA